MYAEGTPGYRPEAAKFYAIRHARDAYEKSLFASRMAGAEALEYGCGLGERSAFLARGGARVTAIDISPVAIERATENAEREGQADRIDFRVMNAEQLDLADARFDLVTAAGVLHHLDLERSLPELARVMKPDGVGVFSEPLGHNPLLNLYRRRTPELRTHDEQPLLARDLDLIARHFGRVQTRFFHLTSVPAFALRRVRGFHRIVTALEALDQILFRVFPPLRRHAWFVVFEVAEPRTSAPPLPPRPPRRPT